MHNINVSALFFALFSVVIDAREDGIRTVTATKREVFSTAVAAQGPAGGLLSVIGISNPAQPTTLFVTVHTRPLPSNLPAETPSAFPTETPPALPSVQPSTSSSYPSNAAHHTKTKTPTPTPGGKRGLSYNDPSLLAPFTSPEITWTYNWASDPYWGNQPPNTYSAPLKFIPMLWNLDPALTSIWSSNVATARKSYGADAVLAFNEPDGCCSSCGNSCISPSVAASAYKQYIQPLRKTLELGAPAVTNGVGPGIGMDWMSQFVSACTGCTIDFMPIHWYGDVTNPDSFKAYLKQFHKRFGKPIWVTEFGTTSGSDAQVLAFLKIVVPWMDAKPWVLRYAYFMDRAAGGTFLLNGDKSMTSIGQYYDSG